MQVQAASQLLIDELADRHTHGFAHEISGMAPNTVAAAPPASLEETGAGLTVVFYRCILVRSRYTSS